MQAMSESVPPPAPAPGNPPGPAPISGKEKLEHMILYCKTILQKNTRGICAFYIEDFDDCDETTLRVIQRFVTQEGYVTKEFIDPATKSYKGFWAWHPPAS